MIKSLSGRVFFVLLVGVIASASLTLWLTLGERQRSLIQYRESHFLERAEQLILDLDALPPENRVRLLQIAPRLGIKINPISEIGATLPENSQNAITIAEKLGPDFHLVSLPSDD